ncbi:MAG: hypothetical protein EB060_08590 [Proteobacteria bacterium]|nr:hypothetical protein [Pseudomonadota bacterium]
MEKIAALKRRLIKEGAILGGALIGLIIIYFVFVFRLSSIQDDIDRVKRETIAINKETFDTKTKNVLIAESLKIYKDLPSQKLTNISLADAASRIRVSRPIIDELRTRYRINEINVNFSKVEDASSKFNVKGLTVYTNQITIDYKALTDELVFSFIDALIKKLPGYVNIEKIEMARQDEITNEVMSEVRKPNAPLPSLVAGKIVLNWWTLKQQEPGDASAETPAVPPTGTKPATPAGGASKL